jgi:chromosome segregation ATPase
MSNEFLKTADDAKRLLKGFAAIQTVADAFEQVGSLQQAKTEAEKAIPKLQAQVSEVNAELDKAKADVKAAKAEAKDIVSKAKDGAEQIIAEAQRKSEEIAAASALSLNQAKTKEAEAVAGAQDLVSQLEAKRNALNTEVATLEAKVEKAKSYIAKLGA